MLGNRIDYRLRRDVVGDDAPCSCRRWFARAKSWGWRTDCFATTGKRNILGVRQRRVLPLRLAPCLLALDRASPVRTSFKIRERVLDRVFRPRAKALGSPFRTATTDPPKVDRRRIASDSTYVSAQQLILRGAATSRSNRIQAPNLELRDKILTSLVSK
jgi:hypothetical protein